MKQSSNSRARIYRDQLSIVFGNFDDFKLDIFKLIDDVFVLDVCGVSFSDADGKSVLVAGEYGEFSNDFNLGFNGFGNKLCLHSNVEIKDRSVNFYLERWRMFFKFLHKSIELTRRSQELTLVTSRLIETTDQLVSLYDVVKGLPEALASEDLDRFLVNQVAEIVDCSAVLFINNEGSKFYYNDSELNSSLYGFWCEASGSNRIFRSKQTGLDFDVVVVNFVESGKGGFVLCSRNRISTEHNRLIQTVVAHTDGVLAVSNLHNVRMDNAMLNHDIELASSLADRVMPKSLPSFTSVDLAARCNYARMASGDFYSCFSTPYGGIVALGDISGKGLPAAIVMSIASSVLGFVSKQMQGPKPDEIISIVNTELFEYLSSAGVFITLAVATWESDSSRLQVANAGHSPVAVVSDRLVSVAASSPPLGVLEELNVSVDEFSLAVNDFLFLGSDGLVEQVNDSGQMLGYQSLFDFIYSKRGESSSGLVSSLFDLVGNFAGNQPQDDDRTALVLRRV